MATNCAVCLKSITTKQQKLNCADCTKDFHPACCKMSRADVDCLSVEGLVWRCQHCSVERRKSMRFESKIEEGNLTLSDVMKLLSEMREEQKASLKDFNVSYEVMNEKLSENTEMLKKQAEDLKLFTDELTILRDENVALKKKVNDLEERLCEAEQYSRRNCLEIQGIPEEKNENLIEKIKQVGRALDISIEENMIDVCHRLKKRKDDNRPTGIIVKFVRRVDAEEVLRKRRVKRNLSTRHMGLPTDEIIYVNEALCPARRKLFAQARAVKRDKGNKYLWVRSGNIYIRKEENAPVIQMSLVPYLVRELLHEDRPMLYDQHFGLGLSPTSLPTLSLLSHPYPYRLRPLRLGSPHYLESGMSKVVNDKDSFKVNLDVQQFKPDELTVKIVDNHVVIEGKHEERSDEHGYVSRQFTRRYRLPDDVDAQALMSSLSSDGVLQLVAPKKSIAGPGERNVPITKTNTPAVTATETNRNNEQKSDDKA